MRVPPEALDSALATPTATAASQPHQAEEGGIPLDGVALLNREPLSAGHVARAAPQHLGTELLPRGAAFARLFLRHRRRALPLLGARLLSCGAAPARLRLPCRE